MENPFNHPAARNLFVALLALTVVFMAAKSIAEIKAVRYVGAGVNATNVITVNGTGEVVTAPDIATFTFGVSEEAASVPEAQKKATDKMSAILDYVKKSDVSDKDVKTLSYNIYPRYEYHATADTPYYGGGKQVLAAYVVSQTIQVKVRKLDSAGKLLSGIGEFGATDVSGLSFSVDKQTEVERQARDKAIADAREQANILARSLGVSLGRIVSFSEAGSGYPMPIYYAKDARVMGAGVMNEAATASVPSGENKVTSNVTITYEIR
ncbi:MAG TPA: SIMPL domain-containing protein [Candidatus Paceibacterota bacterium]|nr:SIMPL domain-containing protein [Candidatus Paceibacterota bacterium]